LSTLLQHRAHFPPVEFGTLEDSLARMVADLDAACEQSVDPPEDVALPVIQTVRTGRRGRPSKLIDRTFLQYALEMRGPARIARLLDCCPRTVRRAALRHGLVQPAPPVFRTRRQADGTVAQEHTTVTAPVSTLTDQQLDEEMRNILSMVIHGFVDGHSRFVTSIKVNTNNRADSVLDVFL
ncbi:hypothetical protein C8Q76DRAFT_599877, partial [Earliella scabrosa]